MATREKGLEEGVCQCEHEDHFEGGAHEFGAACDDLVAVHTEYGWYVTCRPCATGHLAEFVIGVEEDLGAERV